jgi:hypothetical protein
MQDVTVRLHQRDSSDHCSFWGGLHIVSNAGYLAQARSMPHPCSAAQVHPDKVYLMSEPRSNRCQHLFPAPQEAAPEPVVCTEHIRRVRMQVHIHLLPALQTGTPFPDQFEILCTSHDHLTMLWRCKATK